MTDGAAGGAAPAPRDRDDAGRARNARPRDGLGRPLPYGAPGVERAPEGVRRTPDSALSEAQRLLDAGMPFHAHEVLEDAWKLAAAPERGLWRGLAQLAVGLTHALRGNTTGARSLLSRGTLSITPYRDRPLHGVDVAGLLRWSMNLTEKLDAGGGAVPAVPRLRGQALHPADNLLANGTAGHSSTRSSPRPIPWTR
jgi:predicted metal-dependent hydrolase